MTSWYFNCCNILVYKGWYLRYLGRFRVVSLWLFKNIRSGSESKMSYVDIHKYHYAVVSKIPESFARNAHRLNPQRQLDLGMAIKQHDEYVDVLRRLGIDILELPPDERHPECVFVADTAVVINGTALICKPSDRRIGEVIIYSHKILGMVIIIK